jgi:Flp pilus assembly protein TadD
MYPPPPPPSGRRRIVRRAAPEKPRKRLTLPAVFRPQPLALGELLPKPLRSISWQGTFRTAVRGGVAVGLVTLAAWGIWALVGAIDTRTVDVCVLTDYGYRQQRADWQTRLKPIFTQVNRAFSGTKVAWRIVAEGEAYPAKFKGTMAERFDALDSSCKADVTLALTGREDPAVGAISLPFSHAVLVSDPAPVPADASARHIALALAGLFGVAQDRAAQPGAPVLDGTAVELVRKLRPYDFRRGAAALPGSWERRAIDALTAALSKTSPRPEAEARHILGRSYLVNRRHADAVRMMRAAVRIGSDDPLLHFDLAMALESDAETDDAIAEFRAAAALDPRNAWPHAAMGTLYANSGRAARAADEFRIATQLEPRNASYHAALGQALSRIAGRAHEAEAAYQDALRLQPDTSGAFAGWVREQQVGTEFERRAEAVRTELSHEPNSAAAHLRAGVAYAFAGNLEAAQVELRLAVQLDPSNASAHLALARTYLEAGHYREADAEVGAAKAAGAHPSETLVEAIWRKLNDSR